MRREWEKEEHLERMKKLEIEANASPISSTNISNAAVSSPKLPQFTDGEDISAYLVRFERIAQLLNINEDRFALLLGTLLTGKALNIYASLSSDITDDYQSLKEALLTGFRKTPEGFRTEFRSMRLKSGETYAQFAVQLGRIFDFWIESCQLDKTYENLRNFVLVDQFIASIPNDLKIHIKEHNERDLQRIITLADNWAGAHGAYAKDSKYSGQFRKFNSKPNSQHANPKSDSNVINKPKCYACGSEGHIKRNCPKNPLSFKHFEKAKDFAHSGKAESKTYYVNSGNEFADKFVTTGTVNGITVNHILRDSGCTSIIVSEKVLPNIVTDKCETVALADYLGRVNHFPLLKCYIDCSFYCGDFPVVIAPLKHCDVLIGNVEGVKDVDMSIHTNTKPVDVNVVTRSKSHKQTLHPLVLPLIDPLKISPSDFAALQKSCNTLADIRDKAATGKEVSVRDGSKFKFSYVNNLLYRVCTYSKYPHNIGKSALITPLDCRSKVLEIAHESPLSGHFSHRKTEWKVRDHFFWPNMGTDIRNFCRSCDRCQRVSQKGRVKRAPMVRTTIITEPFSRVNIDLVGPLVKSEQGHCYILTLIDMATGFVEALPLKTITSIDISEALLSIFSRVGIPKEILSDRGSQFTSQLMGEVHELLGIKALFNTPYHPMASGRIERVHSTLKACLRKLCQDKLRQWHIYLIPTLFALRELPSDRTGFSAFEMLYGRKVRGPLAVLRDLWENSALNSEERDSFQYIVELREKLEDCAKIAASRADISATQYKSYFDLKSQDRQFIPGDEVLLLLPDSKKKMLMAW